ncbi:MAG: serine protease [Treponema sp.]|nr:serine protease [Treponema sp.]
MRKIFLAAAALLIALPAFSQIKNYVGVVREQYYPAHTEFLKDLSATLKNRGYSSYASYVDAYLQGGFGSGFVYVDKDGTNYVITNRHVVSQAASASIEFENEDGSVTRYENLSVLITDDDIDLAILRFAENANPFKKGLSLYTGPLSDGQDVNSAGFPGLGDEPVWQFGKGSITNAKARIKDLIDPSISTVIQHSAQIDGGNSGGPLLVASKTSPFGYEVAGINTWKAIGRDSTNFSIPARLVLTLLEKSRTAQDEEAAKTARIAKFKTVITESSNDYTALVPFVSYEYASNAGVDYFEKLLRYGATAVRNRVAGEFAGNPIEGLRYAVAYNLHKELSGENATEENLSGVVWQKEHGLYRIASNGEDKKSKKAKNAASRKEPESKKHSSKSGKPDIRFEPLASPYTFALNGGLFVPVSTDEEYKIKQSVNLGGECFVGEGLFGMEISYEGVKAGSESISAFGAGLIARLPLNFTLFCISPKAAAGAKIAFGDPMLFQTYWNIGLVTTFNFGSESLRPGFEVSYQGVSDTMRWLDVDTDEKTTEARGLIVKLTVGLFLE